MTDREMELERIEMYCDADRRRRVEDQDELEAHCPTIEEAMISREIG